MHGARGDTEAYHGIIDYSVVLQRPEVVHLLLAGVFSGGKSKDSVALFAKTLRLVECQEFKQSTLVVFELELQVDGSVALQVQGLDAHVILPDKSLKLGRAVGKLRGLLREDFVGR